MKKSPVCQLNLYQGHGDTSAFHSRIIASMTREPGAESLLSIFRFDPSLIYRNLNSLRRKDSICTLFSVRAYRIVNFFSALSDTSVTEMMFTSCR
jgi:hypothetical protein